MSTPSTTLPPLASSSPPPAAAATLPSDAAAAAERRSDRRIIHHPPPSRSPPTIAKTSSDYPPTFSQSPRSAAALLPLPSPTSTSMTQPQSAQAAPSAPAASNNPFDAFGKSASNVSSYSSASEAPPPPPPPAPPQDRRNPFDSPPPPRPPVRIATAPAAAPGIANESPGAAVVPTGLEGVTGIAGAAGGGGAGGRPPRGRVRHSRIQSDTSMLNPAVGGKQMSLRGFDPLDVAGRFIGPSPPGSLAATKGVWTSEGSFGESGDVVHPLSSSVTPSNLSSAVPTPPGGGSTPRSTPAAANHRTSKTLCMSDLRDLAAALSVERPRVNTAEEDAQMAQENHRITLGGKPKESTGTKKSHHVKKASSEVLGMLGKSTKAIAGAGPGLSHHHRKTNSGADAVGGLVDDINDMGGGRALKQPGGKKGGRRGSAGEPRRGKSPMPSPAASPMRTRSVFKHRKSSDASPSGTPLTGGSGHRKKVGNKAGSGLASLAPPDLMTENESSSSAADPKKKGGHLTSSIASGASGLISSISTAGSNDGGGGEVVIRSSELDPSLHQMEIPPPDEFLVHAKCCYLMETYRVVDQNFDFGTLVGMSRMSLEAFGSGSPGGTHDDGWSRFTDRHRPIVKSVLTACDDLVVEGFFHEEGNDEKGSASSDLGKGVDKSTHDRVEVAVFSSQKRRQFIAAYRGTSEQQVKPVRNRHVRANNPAVNLHADQPLKVFQPFRSSYFKSDLEGKVFRLLDELSETHPFCDVVTTGHSFGAALATIGGMRYATARPMMRVSCVAFGSPKVGLTNFRLAVNSLPNLKTMRVEYGSDPWVHAPEPAVWSHVGHAIVVNSSVASAASSSSDAPTSTSASSSSSSNPPVLAYRFDKNRPGAGGVAGLTAATNAMLGKGLGLGGMAKLGVGHGKHEKIDREMRAYVHAIEQFAHLGLPWVKGYVGEDVGRGVKGKNNEKRLMV